MNTQKPTLVHLIAWMTLASGIINLFWGIAATFNMLVTILGAICIPFTILPTILGIFELIYAAKLFSNPAQPVKPSTNLAIFEIACVLIGNIFSMVVGILALVFYNDLAVKEYFARLNEVPAPTTPTPPASSSDLSPAPVMEESPLPPAEQSPTPQPTPAKPKQTPRKVAKK